MLRKILITFVFISISILTNAQTSADSLAIKQTALDFIEGWYAGDATRMERSLHRDVISKLVVNQNGRDRLAQFSGLFIVKMTRDGGGKQLPKEKQLKEVSIHSIFQNAASVQIKANDGMEFLHMVKWDNEWKILNIMFEPFKN